MNVAMDAWIPVVDLNGIPKRISLLEALAHGERYTDLNVRPHERVALMRLFVCITHASINGPKDEDEWESAPEILPEAVDDYLNTWKDSFELFHPEKPWLQMASITKEKPGARKDKAVEKWTPVSTLNFSMATGNASTCFDHEGLSEQRKIPIEDVILSMLTFQCFSLGGTMSQVYWDGLQSIKTSKDAPCAPASMAHAFIRCANLKETVLWNTPTYEQVIFSYGEREIGRPVWEQVPSSRSDELAIANATTSYMGRLVPLKRLMKVFPGQNVMLLGDGLVYPTYADGFPQEPTATVSINHVKGEETRNLLSFRPDRALWRELGALMVKRAPDNGGPLCLSAIPKGESFDLLIAALGRNQAKILDTVESVFHIPANMFTVKGRRLYEAGVAYSEFVAKSLGWAVESYRKEIDVGWEGRLKSAGTKKLTLQGNLHAKATTHYWTQVEKQLSVLMDHVQSLGSDKTSATEKAWCHMCYFAARDAYSTACGQDTPRMMRGFVKGLRKLQYAKSETFERLKNKETV